MNDLSEKLSHLSVHDDVKQTLFKLTQETSQDEIEELNKQLITYTQDKQKSKCLYEILIDDTIEFIKLIKKLNDHNLLVTILHDCSEPIVQNVLSNLRILIKNSMGDDLKTYLNLYNSVMTHLKVSNPQHLQLFLTYLKQDKDLSQIILVLVLQNLQLKKDQTVEIINDYLSIEIDENLNKKDIFMNLIIILDNLFPILPEVCKVYYEDDRLRSAITSSETSTSILKLINSSNIVENCRSYNLKHYYELLVDQSHSTDLELQILSSLNLIKLWKLIEHEKKHISIQSLTDVMFINLKSSSLNQEYIEYVIEGLMYLSLQWNVRDSMRMDVDLIEKLIHYLNLSSLNISFQYSILSIFANLTKLIDINSTSKQKLKNFNEKQENQEGVKLFNQNILNEYKLIDIITSLKTFKSSVSNNSMNQVISIIYHLSMDQKLRTDLVQQNGLNMVINYLLTYSDVKKEANTIISTPKHDGSDVESRTIAIRCLARMLISIDPSSIKHDIRTLVPFLVELLGPNISKYNNERITSSQYLLDMTLLDRYESLMALTNISTIPTIKDFIINLTFDDHVNNFIIDSSNSKIQLSSWQLVSNLITQPIMLAKFFNVEKQENLNRFNLLLKLLNSNDEQLQSVIAGLLVNATDFDMIVNVILENENTFLETIYNIIMSEVQIKQLITPICFLLVNIIFSIANKDEKMLKSITLDKKFKDACKNVLQNAKDEDSKQAIMEILKIC